MASISLRGIKKSYGDGPQVVKGLDLEVKDGEFMVFVGPSGCGKSTLLRMIAGLEEISDGQLRIGEMVANDVAPAERGIAMVFQSYALYPHMTVRQNMGFALRLSGQPDATVRAAVDKVAEILRIGHLLERKPKALSGGERQRVAIGRAIVRQPKVFLFDEPLSNLDASLRVQTRIELAKLHQELGTTMIYVTHDQVEAMTLGDRVAVFNGGYMEQVGAPLELYQQPASQFVAGFIGAMRMNFLPCQSVVRAPGTDEPRGGRYAVISQHCRFALPEGASAIDYTAGLTIGIRPEHLRVTAPGEGSPARIRLIEQLGDAQVIHATLKDSEHSVSIKLHGEMRHDLRQEQDIGVLPDERKLFLFDSGGRAISMYQS
jgi:multiple sugar transport system ATP-binding protein